MNYKKRCIPLILTILVLLICGCGQDKASGMAIRIKGKDLSISKKVEEFEYSRSFKDVTSTIKPDPSVRLSDGTQIDNTVSTQDGGKSVLPIAFSCSTIDEIEKLFDIEILSSNKISIDDSKPNYAISGDETSVIIRGSKFDWENYEITEIIYVSSKDTTSLEIFQSLSSDTYEREEYQSEKGVKAYIVWSKNNRTMYVFIDQPYGVQEIELNVGVKGSISSVKKLIDALE